VIERRWRWQPAEWLTVIRMSFTPGALDARLTSIEVCAGAGGQAIGLHQAGFDHRALVEIDRYAAETLRVNGERLGWWAPEVVHEASLVGWRPVDSARIDLVAGGVPCPPFSIAGRQLGADDERDLFPFILDLVASVKPQAVMIENVRGLLGKKFDGYRGDILSRLNSMGYAGEWELLEAHEYGVPQLRPRSVLIAAKPAVWKYFKWPTPGEVPTPTVGEVLFAMMAEGGWVGARAWRQIANDIAPTLVGGSRKHGGADLGPTRAKRQWLERLGVNALVLADEPPAHDFRGTPKLTVEMAAAVQGFPPDWYLAGGKTARYRQIGNAFPPPVAAAVGRQVALALRAAQSAM
jgi:DNA (cytosine-5)-methyltransferase 1